MTAGPSTPFQLSDAESRLLLELARGTVEETVGASPWIPPVAFPPRLRLPGAVFVTLRTDGELRGCIGRIHPVPGEDLVGCVRAMARAAATRDPRFPPLAPRELARLTLEISVLSPLVALPVELVDRIEVGRHGILLRRGGASGLLLPQVAVEHAWDRLTFLRHTAMKAGLDPESWRQCEIEIFEALILAEEDPGRFT